jgi:predicted RecA/RadA family phage recombinase
MNNYVQPGRVIDAAMPYDRTSGDGVLVGTALFGVCVDTKTSGQTGPIATEGVYDITKATNQALAIGARAYWDNTNKRITTTSSGNLEVGVCVGTAAGTTDATARIMLGQVPATPVA